MIVQHTLLKGLKESNGVQNQNNLTLSIDVAMATEGMTNVKKKMTV